MSFTIKVVCLTPSGMSEAWSVIWPICAILLTGVTSYYFYHRSKRHSEWRAYAQRIHNTLVPLHEMIGVFYAHGLEYPNSKLLSDAIDMAVKEKLSAMKLGRSRYERWNQAVSSASQCHLSFRLHISGEAVDD